MASSPNSAFGHTGNPVTGRGPKERELMTTLKQCLSGFCQARRWPAAMVFMTLALSLLLPPAALAAGTWIPAGSMAKARQYHTATLLPNGKVLVAGGVNYQTWLASAELYDPSSWRWTATGSLATAHWLHTATLLPNGQVLVAGGYDNNGNTLASAELYDPASGSWAATGNLNTARTWHTVTLLPNGKVLAAGGYNGSYLTSAELYDPASGLWTATGSLADERSGHTATLLPNGKVLVAAGDGYPDFNHFWLASAELYDPAAGAWSATGSLARRRSNQTATLLTSGKVLVAGGSSDKTGGLASAELYDPAAGTWSATRSMAMWLDRHTATLLPNGQVLVAGGDAFLATAELYLFNRVGFSPGIFELLLLQ